MDSAIIGALVGLAKQARDAGGDVLLAAVPPGIMQTLSLLHLNQFFVIVADTNSGLAYSYEKEETAVSTPPASQTTYAGTATLRARETVFKETETEWVVCKAPRRLDAMTALEFTETCHDMLVNTPYLILDLSDTVLLASAGLAALAKINRDADEINGALRVVNCSEDVMRVIKMVRFDKVLSLYSDVDAAVSFG